MPITVEQLRELLEQRERHNLDFKEVDYAWKTAKKAAQTELAKDLMAFANYLTRGEEGYILIGVKERKDTRTGEPVGWTDHRDDADLHQRVAPILNRVPHFEYGPVAVDGILIGVYRIVGDLRPYFPKVTRGGVLTTNVPLVRVGSHTATVPPDDYIRWHHEDQQRLQRPELVVGWCSADTPDWSTDVEVLRVPAASMAGADYSEAHVPEVRTARCRHFS